MWKSISIIALWLLHFSFFYGLIICFLYNLIFIVLNYEILEYEVREKPALSTWMQGGLDYIMLQYLNIDGIRTIGSVLGQSIALDYYGRQVCSFYG